MRWTIVFIVLCIFGVKSEGRVNQLSGDEKMLYKQRHFIELIQHLLVIGQSDLAQQIQKQDSDLGGCRAIHHGNGNWVDVLRCMHFLSRERKLGFSNVDSRSVFTDVEVLCVKLAEDDQNLYKLVSSEVFKASGQLWPSCREEAWRQVYLTAYANFETHPIQVLGLVRRAQADVPGEFRWKTKALQIIRGKKELE